MAAIGVDIFGTLFDGLTEAGSDGQIVPGLASSWKGTKDNTVWSFTIRDDVRFQDGSALSLDDIVFTYRSMIANKNSPVHTYVDDISTVDAVGEHGIRVTLRNPSYFPEKARLVRIVSKASYLQEGAEKFARKPVGTGPYKVTGFVPGVKVSLAAFPDYWRGEGAIKRATLSTISDQNTRLTGLQSADLDVAQLDVPGLRSIQGMKNLTVRSVASNKVMYIGFNLLEGPGSELKFRQAVSYAIDSKSIAKYLFNGKALQVAQVLAPSNPEFDEAFQPPVFDPAKAKALLGETSYDGRPIELAFPGGEAMPQGVSVMQAVQQNLKDVGIDVTFEATEMGSFLNRFFAKKLPSMYAFAYTGTTGAGVYSLLNSVTPSSAAVQAKVDNLVSESARAAGEDARRTVISQITRYHVDNATFAPLISPPFNYVFSNRVKGVARYDGCLRPYDLSWAE